MTIAGLRQYRPFRQSLITSLLATLVRTEFKDERMCWHYNKVKNINIGSGVAKAGINYKSQKNEYLDKLMHQYYLHLNKTDSIFSNGLRTALIL
jgi:hypothetical protein